MKKLNFNFTITVPPGYENSWRKVITAFEDITEKKQADEDLRRSEEQFRRQFENNLIPAYMWKKVENEDDYVLIDGNVRRRKCNLKHLVAEKTKLEIKEGASTKDVLAAFKKAKLEWKRVAL